MKPNSNSSRHAKISAFVSKGKENMVCAAGCTLGVFFTFLGDARTRCFGRRRLTTAGAAGRVLWRNGALDVERKRNKVKRARSQLA